MNNEPQRAGSGGGETVPISAGGSEAGRVALVEVLEAYLAALEAGGRPDRAGLLAAHPELAPRLEEAMAGLDFIYGVGAGAPGEPRQLGDFRIVREVGRGGMGVVYEAEQVSLKRRVALKVLRLGGVADAQAMQRFQREAETVAGLHHTNIVPIYAVGNEAGVRYYAMQFIDGRNLAEVASGGRESVWGVDAVEVARWGLQAAEALAHAHRQGVIHRDIKPSNLILDEGGRVWLTDFGLARRMEDATLSATGALLGTPRYMSPEQAGAAMQPVDHRTDVYSLGATLYELATARPPFDGATARELLQQIVHEEPRSPRSVAPHVPRDLETILLKCLAKEPGRRYATAQAMADDLRAFIEGRPIRARRASGAERALRWARKHRRSTTVAAWSMAASVALVLGVGVGWSWLERSRRGWLTLNTGEAQVQASVHGVADDREVVPAFTLPTRQPVALAAGDYRVRLAATNVLDQWLDLRVERGRSVVFEVGLGEASEIAPVALERMDVPAVVDLEGGPCLAIARRWGVRCVDLSSGATRWQSDLRPEAGRRFWGSLGEEQAWSATLQRLPQNAGPQLARPAPDLDGDGVGDLVWSSDTVPAVLALSGRTGSVLWWRSGSPPSGADGAAAYRAEWGLVAGSPVVVDVDGDGGPDLIALMASGACKWLEALSGRTGQVVWRRGLEAASFRQPPWAGREMLPAPRLVRGVGGAGLVVVAGTRLLLVDPRDGAVVWSQALPHVVLQEARVADLDRDGGDDVLLLGEGTEQDTSLVALAPGLGRLLWTQPVAARFRPSTEVPRDLDWPVVTDLDGDGRPEILVPSTSVPATREGPGAESYWSGVDVLRGEDGARRWRRELVQATSPDWGPPVNRFLVGPDLDGDGVREVFSASLVLRSFGEGDTRLRVDAMSGRTGRSVWTTMRAVPARSVVGALTWWGTGVDGGPRLVVPMAQWPRRPGALWVLEGRTGAVGHWMAAGYAPWSVDCTGDGLPELLFRVPSAEADVENGPARLLVRRGESPQAWGRLARAVEPMVRLPDLNGDGWEEVVVSDPVSACSGATGALLWGSSIWSREVRALPLPAGDMDGDGVPELLVLEPAEAGGAGPARWVLLSGKTGERRWRASVDGARSGGGWSVACLGAAQGKQDPAVLVVTAVAERAAGGSGVDGLGERVWLLALSGRDGMVRWRQPLSPVRASSDGLGRWRASVSDLDGDGLEEVVVGGLETETRGVLRAHRGLDGGELWSVRLTEDAARGRLGLASVAPQPVIGDLDGDGAVEVLVVDPPAGGGGALGSGARSVVALDGKSGERQWVWGWTEAEPGVEVVPVLGVLERGNERAVLLAISAPTGVELVRLSARGEPLERRLVRGPRAMLNWACSDLDGDGLDEVVALVEPGAVWVYSAGLRDVLWRGRADRLLGVLPGAGGGPAEVVVQRGLDMVGLAGATGALGWRCTGGGMTEGTPWLLRHVSGRVPPRSLGFGPGGARAPSGGVAGLVCRVATAVEVASDRSVAGEGTGR